MGTSFVPTPDMYWGDPSAMYGWGGPQSIPQIGMASSSNPMDWMASYEQMFGLPAGALQQMVDLNTQSQVGRDAEDARVRQAGIDYEAAGGHSGLFDSGVLGALHTVGEGIGNNADWMIPAAALAVGGLTAFGGGGAGAASAGGAGAEALTGVSLPAGLGYINPALLGTGASAGALGMLPAAAAGSVGTGLLGAGALAAGGANALLPGAGVLAPAAGVPATAGQAALAGAGLPAGLGGASTGLPAALGGAASAIPGVGGGGSALSGIPDWLNNWGSLITGGLGLVDALNQPDSMTTSQGGTSTSSSGLQLPAEITGPAGQGLQGLLRLFQQGSPRAPISPLIGSSASRLAGMGANPFATGANPNDAATASMFAGGQTINPYLDQVFNTAANSTQNRLASEFAHAGRINTGSHQEARSQELQNLAAGIYAPGFESERQRQYGASEAGVDRRLSQLDANLGRQFSAIEGNLGRDLSQVPASLALGDYMTQYGQSELDAPWMNLQRLLSGLGGLSSFFPGTQTQNTTQTGNITQPLFSNPLAGFAGGALLGQGIFGRA